MLLRTSTVALSVALSLVIGAAFPVVGAPSSAANAEDALPAAAALTPLKGAVSFPLGVAIDARETTGPDAQAVTRHFGQVTSENSMKPDGWYDGDRQFRMNDDAIAIMDFAQRNDLRVYGHTLVWHAQTPDWFFQDDDGRWLDASPEAKETLRDRMRAHIRAVAADLSERYGKFGSATNPLVAFDVVNEVIDEWSPSGLREGGADDGSDVDSRWFRTLGEEFIGDAFRYADEAFNVDYAQDGSVRPVALFLNDYGTEWTRKGETLHGYVTKWLGEGVPIDGVGHQLHVGLDRPVADLAAALARFDDLPVVQAATELDVTTGVPVTADLLQSQREYYRDAFNLFRSRPGMFSVSVWGLKDSRSWVESLGAPLLFEDSSGILTAKPAALGMLDGAPVVPDPTPSVAPEPTPSVTPAPTPSVTAEPTSGPASPVVGMTVASGRKQIYGSPAKKRVRLSAVVTGETSGTVTFTAIRDGRRVTLGKARVPGTGGLASVTLAPTLPVGRYTAIRAQVTRAGAIYAAQSSTVSFRVIRATVSKVTVRGKDFVRGTRPKVTVQVGKQSNGAQPSGRVVVKVKGRTVATVALRASKKGKVTVRLPQGYVTSVAVKAKFIPAKPAQVAGKASATVRIRVKR